MNGYKYLRVATEVKVECDRCGREVRKNRSTFEETEGDALVEACFPWKFDLCAKCAEKFAAMVGDFLDDAGVSDD